MSAGPDEQPGSEDPARTTSEAVATSPDQPQVEEPHGEEPDGEAPTEKTARCKRGILSFLQELPVLLVIAFILALLIKSFLMQAFYIPSESMEPTLNVGDRVLVNKVVYKLHPPRRGD